MKDRSSLPLEQSAEPILVSKQREEVKPQVRISKLLKSKTKALTSEINSSSSEEPDSPTLSQMSLDDESFYRKNLRASFDRKVFNDEDENLAGFKFAKSYKKVQERIDQAMRETNQNEQNSSRVLLYVIKMAGSKLSRTPTVNI